tara:strand:+ start:13526 stop:14683 length:1158 start_codon:yes stop_codon:yes gene_type:complete
MGTFVDRFGAYIYPFLVLFLTDQGLSKESAGFGMACVGIGGLGAGWLGGYLSDLIGRRKTIAISMIGGGFFAISLYLATIYATQLGGYWATFVAAGLYGLVRGMYHPASSSLVADIVPPKNRVAAFALLRFAINLGFALGMMLGGHLAEISFLILFLLDTTTSVIFGIAAVFFLPQGIRSERSQASWIPALKVMKGSRAFLLVFINAGILAIVFVQMGSSFAVHLRDGNYGLKLYGWLMAFNGLLIVFLEMPISAWTRRFSAPHMIALGSLLAGLGFATNAFAVTWIGFSLAMFTFTVGEMISMPVQGAYVSQLAPESMRGRFNGAIGFAWSGANVVGPILGLWLLGLGFEVLCLTIFCLNTASALMLVLRPTTAPAPQPSQVEG